MNIKSILAIFAGAGVMPADAVKRPPRRFRITQRESSYYKGTPAKPARAHQIATRPAHHEPRFVKHPDPILVSEHARRQERHKAKAQIRIMYRTLRGLLRRIKELEERPVFQNRHWNLVDQYSRARNSLIDALNPNLNSKGEMAKDEELTSKSN